MRFEILGPLRVADEDEYLNLGGRNQRIVLARMLCDPGRPVTTDSLISAIWGDQPPKTAAKNLHLHVYQLRRLLGDSRVVRHPHGYALAATAAELDSGQFYILADDGMVLAAAGEIEAGLAQLRAALRLWRGPVFADLPDVAGLEHMIHRLTELHLTVVEYRMELELKLGRHLVFVSGLGDLVRANPMRERLRSLYMVALYRCGRQADALRAYEDGRRILAEELGVDPGPDLQNAHLAILRGTDPGTPDHGVRWATGSIQRPVPRQLPAGVFGFTGRQAELDTLTATLAGDAEAPLGQVRVAVISGTAGVGKTAFAIHWAHRIQTSFPDGQLYLNLRGYDVTQPMSPIDALSALLRGLGVPPDRIPTDAEECAALYRSTVHDRRLLVLLDNAYSADQVRALIPAGPDSVVLVTSRNSLDGLVASHGARSLALDVLTPSEATELFVQVLGERRVAQDPQAAQQLARLCAYLPLALRIAAAQIAGQPQRAIQSIVDDLVAGDTLDGLAIGGDDRSAIRSAFDLSYRALDAPAQRLFCLLGTVPGNDFDLSTVVALADTTRSQAVRILDQLAAAHLVARTATDRYSFHDLLRTYARRLASTSAERDAARERLYRWYLAVVDRCARLAYPHTIRFQPLSEPVPPIAADIPVHSARQVVAWLADQFHNLVAAIIEADPPHAAWTWRLADGLRGYLQKHGRRPEALEIAETALAAAEADGSLAGQATAHMAIAAFHRLHSRFPKVIEHLLLARDFAAAGGWTEFEKISISNLAITYHEMGRPHQALTVLEALGLDTDEVGRFRLPATLVVMSGILLDLGRVDEAMASAWQAVSQADAIGSLSLRANALRQVGCCHLAQGRFEAALTALHQAVAVQQDLADRDWEAWYLATLSDVHRAAGRPEEALAAAELGLASARDFATPHTTATLLTAAAASCLSLGRCEDAIRHSRLAIETAGGTGLHRQEVLALMVRAQARNDLGRRDVALADAERAVELAQRNAMGVLEAETAALVQSLREHGRVRS